MKKIFFLLFLFSVLILQANQIEVCKSCNISTIKKAIEIAEDGDEIFIRKGVYQENDIEVETENYKGPACVQEVKKLFEEFLEVDDFNHKAEYYETEEENYRGVITKL